MAATITRGALVPKIYPGRPPLHDPTLDPPLESSAKKSLLQGLGHWILTFVGISLYLDLKLSMPFKQKSNVTSHLLLPFTIIRHFGYFKYGLHMD